MEYQDIYDIVKANNGGKFVITYTNGDKKIKRCFISKDNDVCEFKSRSRTRGYSMYTANIVNITSYVVNKTNIDYFRRNIKNVIKYLSNSGLWQDMLKGACHLSTLTDDEINYLKDYDRYYNYFKDKDIKFWNYDAFLSLFNNRAIKTINLDRYNRNTILGCIRHSITNKVNYIHKWRKGYDNSVELRFYNDIACGWYSEEYKDCLNGHYYYLLDDVHALFGEDD